MKTLLPGRSAIIVCVASFSSAAAATAGSDLQNATVCVVADYDGDSLPDMAFGRYLAHGDSSCGPGLTILSTKTWLPILALKGDGPLGLGAVGSLAAMGDLDKDGYAELLVGTGGRLSPGGGQVWLLSGKSLRCMRKHELTTPDSKCGSSVAGTVDVNGDGVVDYLIGNSGFQSDGDKKGAVCCFSGSTGTLIWEARGRVAMDGFGSRIAVWDDIDTDKIPEVLVACDMATKSEVDSAGPRFVTCLSGATGKKLFVVEARSGEGFFGEGLAIGPDVNGDGIREFFVGSPDYRDSDTKSDWVLYDGKSRNPLYSVRNRFDVAVTKGAVGPSLSHANQLGRSIAMCRDVDGDLVPDFVFGDPSFDCLWLCSGATGAPIENFKSPHENPFTGVLCSGGDRSESVYLIFGPNSMNGELHAWFELNAKKRFLDEHVSICR
jgi:hypothetical protein